MRFTISQLAAATGGKIVAGSADPAVAGASIDTRSLRPGQLFVAVVAERDGHDFVPAAIDAGAGAALVSRPPDPAWTVPVVRVDDTVAALRDLGRAARDRLDGAVVGITGSVGKTTVKDLARSVLATAGSAHASVRSFNNDLGVPLTLVEAPDGVAAVVVEMGARGIGHIGSLCEYVRPTVGVVTRVAMAHNEFFGTIDDIAVGKGEMVEHLAPDEVAVLNAGDPRVAAMASRTRARVLTYGVGVGDVRAVDVEVGDDLSLRFRVESPWGAVAVAPAVRGPQQVENATAAMAIGLAVGVSPEAAARGLAAAEVSPWRMEVDRTVAGAVVVNDAYNANPLAVRAALDALMALPARRRVAVLGTMAELGPFKADEHRAIGALVRELGVEGWAVAEADYGLPVVADLDAAVDAVGPLGEGDVVLVKGSRVAGLERLAARWLTT
ncbi:MAG TPA: UDP-N-acetylmuramoyl-tripeptide--D-alanyl-D-alanine ligase [Acidimicrobiales bacterium]|nr:UDP-N-acetylmuramoyl-tripeptide--D-alanyl-D-alanine ligase [Acidimicrobiales bacterium]